MNKARPVRILITDIVTDNTLLDVQTEQGYMLQYPKYIRSAERDEYELQQHGMIEMGWSNNYFINNAMYKPIAEQLIDKFPELQHINLDEILFLEDHFKPPKHKDGKKRWVARVKKANKELKLTWGCLYVIEIRKQLLEEKLFKQIAALIYHELRHIGEDGNLIDHDIEDWRNIIGTLGTDWWDADFIRNVLDNDFRWGMPKMQLTLHDFDKQKAGAG